MPTAKKIAKPPFDMTNEISTVKKINNPEEDKKELDSKSVLIQVRTDEDLKNHLKSYFAKKGLTLSKGLLIASSYLEEAEKLGQVKVGKFGFIMLK